MRIHTQHGELLTPDYLPWGMGDFNPAAIPASITQGAGTAIGTGSDVAGAISGGLVLASAFTGPVAPFLMAAASLVGPIASMFKGCGQTCVEATKIADQAGAALQGLHDQYWALPVHYRSAQSAFIDAFNQIVNYVRQACGNPALGDAGQRCMSERIVRGGTAPWCPTADHRGCDWYTTMYDPVANDPNVVPDPVTPVINPLTGQLTAGSPVAAALSNIPAPLLLGGAALGLFLLLGDN